LVVLVDQKSFSITYSSLALGHQSIAYFVGFAYITVYPLPAFFTLTVSVISRHAIFTIRQRTANRIRAVLSSEPRRTVTLAICFTTWSKLMAGEVFEIAVEAWRTSIRSVIVEGEG